MFDVRCAEVLKLLVTHAVVHVHAHVQSHRVAATSKASAVLLLRVLHLIEVLELIHVRIRSVAHAVSTGTTIPMGIVHRDRIESRASELADVATVEPVIGLIEAGVVEAHV